MALLLAFRKWHERWLQGIVTLTTAPTLQDHIKQPVTSASIVHERTASSAPSRRQAMQLAGIALIAQQSDSAWADEGRGIRRYVKKKALDPLET